jgi:hypothetical protein
MKHFINRGLLAPNVVTMPVDTAIIDEFLPLVTNHDGDPRFHVVRPPWNSDMAWVSANDEATFELFQSAFDRLGVAGQVEPYLDLDRAVRLYCGFLVIRSRCDAPNFHYDWLQANNEAFTLLTPVTGNAENFGMLYRRLDGRIAEYGYLRGEAILLGDRFQHSTKPGLSPDPVALLSFSFGTDRMEHWDKIARTAAKQSALYRLPDGRFERRRKTSSGPEETYG